MPAHHQACVAKQQLQLVAAVQVAQRAWANVKVQATVFQARFQRRKQPFGQAQQCVWKCTAKRLVNARHERQKNRTRQAGTDLARALAPELVNFLPATFHVLQHRARPHHKRLAVHRQRHAFAVALQQRHTEFFFQVAQAACDGRLRQALRTRGAADAGGVSHCHKVAQMMNFHTKKLKRYRTGINATILHSFCLSLSRLASTLLQMTKNQWRQT